MNRNCHARSAQGRQNLRSKARTHKPATELEVLPNGKRKPTSHSWKAKPFPVKGEVHYLNPPGAVDNFAAIERISGQLEALLNINIL